MEHQPRSREARLYRPLRGVQHKEAPRRVTLATNRVSELTAAGDEPGRNGWCVIAQRSGLRRTKQRAALALILPRWGGGKTANASLRAGSPCVRNVFSLPKKRRLRFDGLAEAVAYPLGIISVTGRAQWACRSCRKSKF